MRILGNTASSFDSLYAFTTATFATGGATGINGPNITQARTALGNPAWASTYLNMTTNGIQQWTVPVTANYRFVTAGAQGGGTSGPGFGAILQADVSLNAGEIINIVVGQSGIYQGTTSGGGGGGGTFVYQGSIGGDGLILAAGGGGGQDDAGGVGSAAVSSLAPGLDGNAGSQINNGLDGTGAYEDGYGWLGSVAGTNFVGVVRAASADGGFGGGGGSQDDGGGAGGFTGGSSSSGAGGGNGGSYYAGLAISGFTSIYESRLSNYTWVGTNPAAGYVTVTKL